MQLSLEIGMSRGACFSRAEIRQNNQHFNIKHLSKIAKVFPHSHRPVNSELSFRLDESINNTLLLLKDELIKNSITVNTSLEENITLYGSATEFKHILINLINNTQTRTAFITLQKSDSILLEITDNAERSYRKVVFSSIPLL